MTLPVESSIGPRSDKKTDNQSLFLAREKFLLRWFASLYSVEIFVISLIWFTDCNALFLLFGLQIVMLNFSHLNCL